MKIKIANEAKPKKKPTKYTYHKDGTQPKGEELFVFGSNLAGRHGAGAAKAAMLRFGAVYGVGEGVTGQAYALPTIDAKMRVLTLKQIKESVRNFREHTKRNKHETYFVTRVACVIAGYTDADIAPMFRGATKRCNFPIEWKEYLE
jgi:hypothetical protein